MKMPGSLSVTGWAIDPETTAPITVHAYVDGAWAGAFTANTGRADIGDTYWWLGPNHGFQPLAARGIRDPHGLLVRDQRRGPASRTRTWGASRHPSPRSATSNRWHRSPGTARLTGWAVDPDTVDPITLHVYVDGVVRRRVRGGREPARRRQQVPRVREHARLRPHRPGPRREPPRLRVRHQRRAVRAEHPDRQLPVRGRRAEGQPRVRDPRARDRRGQGLGVGSGLRRPGRGARVRRRGIRWGAHCRLEPSRHRHGLPGLRHRARLRGLRADRVG